MVTNAGKIWNAGHVKGRALNSTRYMNWIPPPEIFYGFRYFENYFSSCVRYLKSTYRLPKDEKSLSCNGTGKDSHHFYTGF